MDEVDEGGVAEIGILRRAAVGEGADTASHEVLDAVDGGLEVCHHLFVYLLVADVDDVALEALVHQPTTLVGEGDGGLGYVAAETRRIEAEHLAARRAFDHFVVHLVVVSEEDGVKAVHLLCYELRGILLEAVVHRDAAIEAAMEEADDEVGLLHLLDILHPAACADNHILKLQPLPQALVQPGADGGSDHAEDGDLDGGRLMVDGGGWKEISLNDGIGPYVGQAGLAVDDIGSNDRTLHLAHPLVVDLMARLHIVIAYGFHVVSHIVDDLCGQVLLIAHDVVRPVGAGLSLKDVAVVEEQQAVAILLPLLLDIGVGPCRRAVQRTSVDKVIGEEVAVNVAGLDDFQLHSLRR